jgi:hypothetical protein
MSILDDAIREHLELKRAHGADDAELKKLEDEAFGPPARPDDSPDPFAEAPTEFLTAPGSDGGEQPVEDAGAEPRGGRPLDITDLQEGPEPPAPPEPSPQPEIDAGPSTEERHAIAEQPTEIFDVEGELATAAESDAPSDDELVDAELAEPRLAPVDPLAGLDDEAGVELEISDEREDDLADEDDDDFFSEQRLSDELNQALETPLPGEPGSPPTEEAEAIVEAPEELDIEEDDAGEISADEHDEADADFDEEDLEDEAAPEAHTEEHPAAPPHAPESTKEDLLEDTPDFLENAPEDDNLWFEQKPPKDFDFDD